tara:strand:+ start:2169 stop:2861 length:693 start_codon:yes stop_codon:yes gene_type:complete
MQAEEKYELLGKLSEDYIDCERCGLCSPTGRERTNVVFGEGDPNASLLIVGEAPGEVEDFEGSPFMGASGEIFQSLLSSFSNRDEVFVTNVVACRPTEDSQPDRNRKPDKSEIAACRERLHKIIEIVDPYVILLLGNTAMKALTKESRSITSIANDPSIPRLEVITDGQCMPVKRAAYATFHPSYLLRHPSTMEGKPLHKSYLAWSEAFKLADRFLEIHKGVQIPNRQGE